MASGANCGQGATSAVFGKFTTNSISGFGDDGTGSVIARGVAASVAGGVGSVMAGGKFENGATTAAFGYLFNYLQHGRYLSKQEGQLVVDQAETWKGTPYKLVGPNSEIQVAGDCSGTTFKIYDAVGDPFDYKMANQFGAAADKEGFPFQRLGLNDARQPGDVLQFSGHLAIYAGQDAKGNDLMWTASTSKQSYVLQQVQYFGKPVIGTFRYQVPNSGN